MSKFYLRFDETPPGTALQSPTHEVQLYVEMDRDSAFRVFNDLLRELHMMGDLGEDRTCMVQFTGRLSQWDSKTAERLATPGQLIALLTTLK